VLNQKRTCSPECLVSYSRLVVLVLHVGEIDGLSLDDVRSSRSRVRSGNGRSISVAGSATGSSATTTMSRRSFIAQTSPSPAHRNQTLNEPDVNLNPNRLSDVTSYTLAVVAGERNGLHPGQILA